MDLAARLQALEDREALRDLKARYFAACDAKDPAAVRACFADGPVHIDYGVVGCFDHADALVALFTAVGCHPHRVEMHHGANGRIELTGADTARGDWSLYYSLINTREQTLTHLGGVYADEYRRTAAGWVISASVFTATSTLVLPLGAEGLNPLFAGRAPSAT